MRVSLLLDTCAMIWLANDEPIASEAMLALRQAREAEELIYISPITAWELGLLVSRGRLSLLMPPPRWFSHVLQTTGVQLADMSPDILISSSFLPGSPPRDPADRILAATAREHGYQLMTRDRPLLAYGEQGHMHILPC
ncbi:MAG TPA: type II toxin-antitoxin system VapC family toxin [Beijerinckiaceae bacterium]|jgi:PIN domain nuclease of toxin-antitoxin system|nr:type II toxin-antitoxin system VapC family toxin [Beijerinckiaceae bacterium]